MTRKDYFMETPDILNSKVLKVFTKRSLVVIGLFVVFYCGVAAFILYFCNNSGANDCKLNVPCVILLIGILLVSLFVFLLFFSKFSFLVKMNYKKLYNFSHFKEENQLKTHKTEVPCEACLMVETIKFDSEKVMETFQKQLLETIKECCKGVKELITETKKDVVQLGEQLKEISGKISKICPEGNGKSPEKPSEENIESTDKN